jgi:hypothetical protein
MQTFSFPGATACLAANSISVSGVNIRSWIDAGRCLLYCMRALNPSSFDNILHSSFSNSWRSSRWGNWIPCGTSWTGCDCITDGVLSGRGQFPRSCHGIIAWRDGAKNGAIASRDGGETLHVLSDILNGLFGSWDHFDGYHDHYVSVFRPDSFVNAFKFNILTCFLRDLSCR